MKLKFCFPVITCILVFYIFSSNEDIIEMILSGEHNDFGPEKLKGLMKILPEQDEVQTIRSYLCTFLEQVFYRNFMYRDTMGSYNIRLNLIRSYDNEVL